ncbi:DUF421 domain-containing protein [Bacillaceae bacterium W0354]
MEIQELLLRITVGFIALFILTRIMGRKEISQMTFFNFVSAIAIGSLTANFVLSPNLSILNGLLAIIGWTIFTLIMGVIDIKSQQARKIIKGDPIIVISNGEIVEKSLKKCRLDIDSLKTMLRQQNVFSLSEVDYAIFETNGKLSVMKKGPNQSVTKQDMNVFIPSNAYPIATEVITDGQIIDQNLKKLRLDHGWLQKQLQKLNIQSISDIFYAEVLQDGSLHVDRKSNN